MVFFKFWPTRPLFHLFLSFQTHIITIFTTNNAMTIQYMGPGFELMTFGTLASSHNH